MKAGVCCLMVLLLPVVARAADPLEVEVKTRKPGDVVGVSRDGLNVTVTSPSGIGGATVQVKKGAWAGEVRLRFQHEDKRGFRSLEGFTLTTNVLKVEGALKDSGRIPFFLAGPDGTFAAKASPTGTVNVTVGEKDGAIEVTLPAHLLTSANRVELQWVDAYR